MWGEGEVQENFQILHSRSIRNPATKVTVIDWVKGEIYSYNKNEVEI
jgi:hypothetical protein